MWIPDYESHLFLKALPHVAPAWDVRETDKAAAYLRSRKEMVEAGVARCPEPFRVELSRIESKLRAWWDAWKEEWIIDRLQDDDVVSSMLRLAEAENAEISEALRVAAAGLIEDGPFYRTIMHFKPAGDFQLDERLLDAIRMSDMQRAGSPAQYDAAKEARAEEIREANAKAGDDAVLGAVDSLSNKSLETMAKVFEALETGETIIAHGDDAKFLQRVDDERKSGILPDSKPHTLRPRRKDKQ